MCFFFTAETGDPTNLVGKIIPLRIISNLEGPSSANALKRLNQFGAPVYRFSRIMPSRRSSTSLARSPLATVGNAKEANEIVPSIEQKVKEAPSKIISKFIPIVSDLLPFIFDFKFHLCFFFKAETGVDKITPSHEHSSSLAESGRIGQNHRPMNPAESCD